MSGTTGWIPSRSRSPAAAATLYVYYRIAPTDPGPALAVLARRSDDLVRRFPGLSMRLMQRAESTTPQGMTWMEVYDCPEGIDTERLEAIEALGATALPGQQGARHAELFVPLHLHGQS